MFYSKFTKIETSVENPVQLKTFINFEIFAVQQLQETLLRNALDKSKVH